MVKNQLTRPTTDWATMSQTGKKGLAQYRSINEDDEETLALRGRRQRRSPVCIWGSFFALMTGTLVFIGATFALLAGFGFFSAPGDARGNETACELPNVRVNCIPEGGRSETEDVCLERGCCWAKEETPSCFYPKGFGYAVDGQPADTSTGKTVNLTRKTGQPSQYGGDIKTVRVDIFYETSYRLRVKVSLHPHSLPRASSPRERVFHLARNNKPLPSSHKRAPPR